MEPRAICQQNSPAVTCAHCVRGRAVGRKRWSFPSGRFSSVRNETDTRHSPLYDLDNMSVSSTSGNMLRRTLFGVRLTTQQLSAAECSSQVARPAVFGSYRSVHRSARLPAITASEARRRPTWKAHQHSTVQARVNGPSPSSKRTIFIQTENTPNPDVGSRNTSTTTRTNI